MIVRSTLVGRLVAAVGLTISALALTAGMVAAADPVAWGKPSVDIRFGSGITFSQPLTAEGNVAKAELLLTFPGSAGPLILPVEPAGGSEPTLSYTYEAVAGELTPNTSLEARWRVTGADGTEFVGPPITALYADDRFDWRTRTDGLVRLHWYEGDEAFADRALAIAVEGLSTAQEYLGVNETAPVDFFVYASQNDIYEALAPDRENVGGQAYPAIRTLFALISPGDIEDAWLESVIPHEITHLVFDTAVASPYGYPPKWLDEGLAVYLSEGYGSGTRTTVEAAAKTGALIPLEALSGQFPTRFDRFGLGYAESVAAVDYLARAHGEDALKDLIAAFGAGKGEGEAFQQAIGQDPAAFEAAWRASVGASEPEAYGPQPGEPGPLPADWGGTVRPDQPTTEPGTGPRLGNEAVALLLAAGALVLALAGGLLIVLRRRPGGTAA